MAGFAKSVELWVADVKVQTHAQAKFVILELFRRVVRRTPVDTGRARGNWDVVFGQVPSATPELAIDRSDGSSRLLEKMTSFEIGQTVWLVNGLPYIRVLEYGEYPNPAKTGTKTVGGFSRRAPQGMVRISVAEFGQIARGRE